MDFLSKKIILVTGGTSFFSQHLCKAWEAEALKAEKHGVRTVLLRIGAVLEKELKLFKNFVYIQLQM